MSKYTPYKDVAMLALSSMSVLNGEWQLAIQGLPTIEIVHCRECKWFDKDNLEDTYCTWSKGLCEAKPDDFCSYGCREERNE